VGKGASIDVQAEVGCGCYGQRRTC
jgi:hypothetical protein